MGIFGKKKDDMPAIPVSDSLDFGFTPKNQKPGAPAPNPVPPSAPIASLGGNKPNKPAKPTAYGIDDAIKLIRSFPAREVDQTFVASIMKQTLESVNVYFSDIIEDAERKEARIQDDSRKVQENIAELTRNVELLKQELIKLHAQLDETVSVKKFLLKAGDKAFNELVPDWSPNAERGTNVPQQKPATPAEQAKAPSAEAAKPVAGEIQRRVEKQPISRNGNGANKKIENEIWDFSPSFDSKNEPQRDSPS